MEPVRVHLAVLSVTSPYANTVAMENIVADRAVSAGHDIRGFEAVRDSEIAIRAQLVGWIEDPDVDVVIVVGEGAATARALQPLVDQSLRELAETIQGLAQEVTGARIGSAAEVARCGSTFVFVLPGSEAAVRVAMDMAILPQLDPQTQPKNLIGALPRLRHDADVTKVDVSTTSVPAEIPPEKTAAGSGMSPRLPAIVANAGLAQPVLQRSKSRTGGDLIQKPDDPTKPIELVALEEQLELSKTEPHAAPTSKDPTTRVAVTPPPDARPTGVVQATTEPVIELVARKPKASVVEELPAAVERGKPPTAPRPKPAAVERGKPPTAPRPKPATGPAPVVIEPRRKHATTPRPEPATGPAPVVIEPRRKQPTTPRPNPATGPAPVVAAKPAAVVVDTPASVETPVAAGASTLPDLPPGASGELVDVETLLADRPKPPPPPPRATPATGAPVRTRALTPPPPPPRTRTLTPPPPPPRSRAPSNVPRADETSEKQRASRPTPPPASNAVSELPQGAFTYPTHERKSKAPIVIVTLLLLGAAAVAFIVLREPADRTAQRPPADAHEQIAQIPIDAVVEAVEPDAEPDDIVVEIEPDAAPPPRDDRRPSKPPKPPKPPIADVTPPPKPPVEDPPRPDPPKPTGECEEVQCVIDKYARPCCARWKPKETFTPTVGTTENLEKPQIKAGVDRVRPRIIACGEQAKVKGTVRIGMSVSPDGNVTGVDVQASPDDALGNCVAAALRGAQFAKTVNGGSFTYPFVF